MAEINQGDLISSGALNEVKELKKEFNDAAIALEKLIATAKGLGVNIKAADSISKINDETVKLTQSQVELQKVEKQIETVQARNNAAYIQQTKVLNDNKQALKEKTQLGDKDAKSVNAQNASIKQLDAALQANKRAYKELATEEQRASKEGQELLSIIQKQDIQLKSATGSVGEFNKNVGNYPTGFGASLTQAGQGLQQIAPGAASAAQGIYGMVKASLAFIATPIGIVVAALGAAIFALTSYFKSSEEGQNRLNKIVAVGSAIFEQFMNVVEGIGEAIYNAFNDPKQALIDFGEFLKQNIINRFVGMFELIPKLGKAFSLLFKGEFTAAGKVAFDAVAKVVTGVESASDKIGNLIADTKKLVDAGVTYGQSIAALEAQIDRDSRKLTVQRAESDLKVAKLRDEAIRLEGSAKRAAIEEAIKLETDLSNKEVAFAKLSLRLSELKRDANGDDIAALKDVADAQAAVLNAEKSRYDNTVKFQKQLEALRDEEKKKQIEAQKEITSHLVAAQKEITESGVKAPKDITKAWYSALPAIGGAIEKVTDSAQFKFNQMIDKIKEGLESAQQIFGDFSNAVGSLMDSLTERRLQKIDEEEKALDASIDRQILAAGDNEGAKKRIEEQGEKRRQALERKRAEAQRKAAIFDKAVALVQAAINTALAISKVIPNPVLIALAAGLGAIQIAVIAAKPIPKYFKGARPGEHKGGAAMVGELGTELMRSPGQDWKLTPSVATVMDIPRGTEIIPHNETMRRLALNGMVQAGRSDRQEDNSLVVSKLDQINSSIRNSKSAPVEYSYSFGALHEHRKYSDTFSKSHRKFNLRK